MVSTKKVAILTNLNGKFPWYIYEKRWELGSSCYVATIGLQWLFGLLEELKSKRV